MKYVIFDLDQTLGHFTELSIVWGCLQTVNAAKTHQDFHRLCEIFENDYFRPGIFRVMRFLAEKKKTNPIKVVLYTNNIGSMDWLKMIISYLEKRVGSKDIFDVIVPGYNPYKGPYQMRSSFDKTYPEIRRCAKIPADAKLIFFDDVEHPGMIHKNITYIKVKPYIRSNTAEEILKRIHKKAPNKFHMNKEMYVTFRRCLEAFQKKIEYSHRHGTTRIMNNDIIQHLVFFLNGKNKKSRRNKKRSSKQKRTRKRRKSL